MKLSNYLFGFATIILLAVAAIFMQHTILIENSLQKHKTHKVIIIDNCEYIIFTGYDTFNGIAHKGNCKNHIRNYIQ